MRYFADRLTLDGKTRRTRDGYLAARAKAARAGIYDYFGREIDPEGKRFAADQVVKVYRPPEEVFAADSVASFLMKPVTNDHPAQAVTADNWKTHARGVVGKALRDGDFLAFDLVLMDADLIRDVESGKRELSNGYASELEFADGVTPEGEPYQVIQRNIRGNHVAVVDRGRAGTFCRIGDCAPCSEIPAGEAREIMRDGETYSAAGFGDKNTGEDASNRGDFPMKTITIDSVPFQMDEQAAAAVTKLQGQFTDATAKLADAETQIATLTTDKANLDAKAKTLETQLADAKPTPAQLRDAARQYQATADKAKALGITVTDAMDEAQIKRATVAAKLGDAAKDWSDTQIAASFATLAADKGAAPIDPVRRAIADGAATITDTKALRDAARVGRYAPRQA
jgi:hypothetical protein